MRSVRFAAALFAVASAPWPALAQSPAAPSTPAAEATPETSPADDDAEESPELRALRLAELEVFARGRPLVDASATPWARLGAMPSAVTSDAPAARPESARGSADLSHLTGLELPDIPVRWDDQVVRFLDLYRDDARFRNIMSAWRVREQRYGATVRAKLRELGVPEDLAYVAMIESGFDPAARSHAGAIGMWQFVRATGEEYGLEVTHWLDERMDPEEATVAGARYLADLYRRFGSWELALAAYNMGYGALLRAIRKFNTNDYWVLSRLEAGLPFETTFYVAKVMACAIVGRNPERFGYAPPSGVTPMVFDRVEVPGGTPIAQIARAAGSDAATIAELNPALRRNRVPPGAALSIRIPAGSTERFARAQSRLSPRHAAQQPYVVRFGETLDDVAQRFRTTASALRTLNELDEATPVGAGFRLVVPAVDPVAAAPDRERPVVAVPERIELPGRRRLFYRVTSEDTADDIAAFFGISTDELRRWNHVDPSASLQSGMFLQLFVEPARDLSQALVLTDDDVRMLVVGTEEFFDFHEAQQGRVRFRYTVQPGDTLTSIAERFELSVGSLGRINRFDRGTTLRAGQQILVYAPRERAPREAIRAADARLAEQAAQRGEPAPAPAAAVSDDGDGTDEAADAAPTSAPPAPARPGEGG